MGRTEATRKRLLDAAKTLFRKEEITPEEIQRLRELIDEKREQDE